MRVAVVEIERNGKCSKYILEVELTNGLNAEGMWGQERIKVDLYWYISGCTTECPLS